MKLNIGSGENKLEGFVNIDAEEKVKPDLIHNILLAPLPYEPDTVETIYCIHNIEHLPMHKWNDVLSDFRRVLIPEGQLVLSYPEFEICVKNFLENKQGQRHFWRACLYGRQLYPGDYHVSPVITTELIEILRQIGFHDIQWKPDIDEAYYTFLTCKKGIPFTREDVLRKEIFGDLKSQNNRFILEVK